MRKFAIIAMALVGSTAMAQATDLPTPISAPAPVIAPATFGWTGAYVGLNGGFARKAGASTSWCTDESSVINGTYCQLIPSTSPKSDGFFGGLHAGFGKQSGNLVFGLETDMHLSGVSGSRAITGSFPFANGEPNTSLWTHAASEKLKWFGTTRARFGFAGFDRTLVYFTAGLAYGSSQTNLQFVYEDGSINFEKSRSGVKFGWAIGIGAEYALSDAFSARIEGLHIDLANSNVIAPNIGTAPSAYIRYHENKSNYNLVRIGLSYKL
jgi:outer membrane immunogenic protein